MKISGNTGGCKVDNRDSAHHSQGTIWDGQVDVLPPPPAEKCNLPYFKAKADLIFKANGTIIDSTGADVTSRYAQASCSDTKDTTRLLFKGSDEWVTCAPGATQRPAGLNSKTLYFEGMCFLAVNVPPGMTGDGTPAQCQPWKAPFWGQARADQRARVPRVVPVPDEPGVWSRPADARPNEGADNSSKQA